MNEQKSGRYKGFYSSSPIQTRGIELPASLSKMVEELARHVHETWAERRLEEGWTYGPDRDDKTKTHPGLVPYEHLSEAEKDYDRQTALETLKGAMALGYEIVPQKDDLFKD